MFIAVCASVCILLYSSFALATSFFVPRGANGLDAFVYQVLDSLHAGPWRGRRYRCGRPVLLNLIQSCARGFRRFRPHGNPNGSNPQQQQSFLLHGIYVRTNECITWSLFRHRIPLFPPAADSLFLLQSIYSMTYPSARPLIRAVPDVRRETTRLRFSSIPGCWCLNTTEFPARPTCTESIP